tara:strand:+ start:20 stop:193 length:174 start_codon:yes stop_codon:yes gene_type:complete
MVSAEFMDIFGFIAFLILITLGISLLKIAKKRGIILIIIGVLGAIVDGWIVISNFLI